MLMSSKWLIVSLAAILVVQVAWSDSAKQEKKVLRVPLKKNCQNSGYDVIERMNVAAESEPYAKPATFKILENFTNTFYVGEIGLGEPAQTLQAKFDTLTSKFWAVSSYCSNCDAAYGRQITCDDRPVTRQFYARNQSHYANRTEDGYVKDILTFNGSIVGPARFEEVYKLYYEQDGPYDASFGLRPYGEGQIGFREESAFSKMKDSFSKPIFSIYLSDQSDGSEIMFGGYDERHFDGNITYVYTSRYANGWHSSGRWDFEFNALRLGQNTGWREQLCRNGCWATIDAFFPFISGPSRVISWLNEKIGARSIGYGMYAMPSCNLAGLPDLVFNVSETETLSLRPSDYIFYGGDGNGCLSSLHANQFLSQSSFIGYEQSTWIFGTPFIRAYYTIFDHGAKETDQRLGFARAKPLT